jgi:hypothetical protein
MAPVVPRIAGLPSVRFTAGLETVLGNPTRWKWPQAEARAISENRSALVSQLVHGTRPFLVGDGTVVQKLFTERGLDLIPLPPSSLLFPSRLVSSGILGAVR